jgi:hypothetical protein
MTKTETEGRAQMSSWDANEAGMARPPQPEPEPPVPLRREDIAEPGHEKYAGGLDDEKRKKHRRLILYCVGFSESRETVKKRKRCRYQAFMEPATGLFQLMAEQCKFGPHPPSDKSMFQDVSYNIWNMLKSAAPHKSQFWSKLRTRSPSSEHANYPFQLVRRFNFRKSFWIQCSRP